MNIEYVDNNDANELIKSLIDDKDYVECEKYDAYLEKFSDDESEEILEENGFKTKNGENGKLLIAGYRNDKYNLNMHKAKNLKSGNSNTNIDKENEEDKHGINSIKNFILKVSASNRKKPHNLKNENVKKIFHINAKKRRIMVSSDESDDNDKISSVRNIVNRAKKFKDKKKC